MDDYTKMRKLFERVMSVDPDAALLAALEAESSEEKSFFTYVAQMVLRRRAGEEVREIVNGGKSK